MIKTLVVSAIKDGTVIDHVPAGQGLRIIRLLNLDKLKNRVTVGLNLASKSMGTKDLIKIEDKQLNETEMQQIALLAPKAKINIVRDFSVNKKMTVHLPESVWGVLICPNNQCVTQIESVQSCFFIEDMGKQIKLICKYCERQFERDHVKEAIA